MLVSIEDVGIATAFATDFAKLMTGDTMYDVY
jgi:hypothetical protein